MARREDERAEEEKEEKNYRCRNIQREGKEDVGMRR